MSNLQYFTSSNLLSTFDKDSNQQDVVLHSLLWWEGLSEKWKRILIMNLDINERFAHDIDDFYNRFWGYNNLESFYRNNLNKEPGSIDQVNSELIRQIKSIKILVASGMQITDTSALNGLTELEYCSLYINDISEFRVKELPKLRYLDLGKNKLSGTQDFNNFPNLLRLDVEKNYGIKRLKINALSKLHTLWCFDNPLQSVEIDKVDTQLFVKCSNSFESPLQIRTTTSERIASNCHVNFVF